LAKIADPDGGPWHRMGDVGYLDDQGRLWMCGRKGHRVQTGSDTLFSLPTEAIFDQHPAVARSALVGVPRPGASTPDDVVPVIVIEPAEGVTVGPDVTGELLALSSSHPRTRAISRVLVHPGPLPTDVRHNAKINRERLALWAAKELR
jgi:acyl-coenzyme A synthetase/AMP-(fatty) acid ligase